MAKSIQVRSLTGWSAKLNIAGDDETVVDLRRKVTVLNPHLSRFKVFCKGVAIADGTPLSQLTLGPNEFLTIIPLAGTKDRGTAARGATGAAARATSTSRPPPLQLPPLPPHEPEPVFSADQPVPFASEGLITLLPGYESRPNRTPTKPLVAASLLPALQPLCPFPTLTHPQPQPQQLTTSGLQEPAPLQDPQVQESATAEAFGLGFSAAAGHFRAAAFTGDEPGVSAAQQVVQAPTPAAVSGSIIPPLKRPVLINRAKDELPSVPLPSLTPSSPLLPMPLQSAVARDRTNGTAVRLGPASAAAVATAVTATSTTPAPQHELFAELRAELEGAHLRAVGADEDSDPKRDQLQWQLSMKWKETEPTGMKDPNGKITDLTKQVPHRRPRRAAAAAAVKAMLSISADAFAFGTGCCGHLGQKDSGKAERDDSGRSDGEEEEKEEAAGRRTYRGSSRSRRPGFGSGRRVHCGAVREDDGDDLDATWRVEEEEEEEEEEEGDNGGADCRGKTDSEGEDDAVGRTRGLSGRVGARRRRRRSPNPEPAEAGRPKRRRRGKGTDVTDNASTRDGGAVSTAGNGGPGSSKCGDALAGKAGHRPRRPKVAYPRSGPAFERAVAGCVLPLPPSLERLQRIFEAANMLYGFLLGKHVQMTWSNAGEALRSQLPHLNITLDDLMLASALVPEVLVTKVMKPGCDHHCGGTEVEAADGRNGGSGDGGGDGGGSLHTLLTAQGWRADVADRAVQLDKLAEPWGPAVAPSSASGPGGVSVSVELIDPGRAFPLLIEEEMVPDGDSGGDGGGNKPNVGVGCGGQRGDGGDGGDDGNTKAGTESAAVVVGGGRLKRRRRASLARQAPPVVLEDGRRLRFATNVLTRRMAAFRHGLVAVLQHLHNDFIGRLAPTELAGWAATMAATIPSGGHVTDISHNTANQSHSQTGAEAATIASGPGKATIMVATAAGAAAATAAAAAAAAVAGVPTAAAPPPWNPITRREWHPLFRASLQRDGFTTQQLRSAAAELRARRKVLMMKKEDTASGGGGSKSRPGTAPRPPTLLKQYEPCVSSTQLTPMELLCHLQKLSWYKGQVVHEELLPARPAAFAYPAAPLAAPVMRALESLGVPRGRLYSHQADAVDAILGYDNRHNRSQPPQSGHHVQTEAQTQPNQNPHLHQHYQQKAAQQQQQQQQQQEQHLREQGRCDGGNSRGAAEVGYVGTSLPGQQPGLDQTGSTGLPPGPGLRGRHVVVATSTASGKSLCYLVPLLQALSEDPDACALLMFPTKALAQDQLRAIRGMMEAAFGGHPGAFVPSVEVYDGDTPMSERPNVRQRVQVVLTNPDMLHATVLPGHRQFCRLLSKLVLVVIDEGHAYGGVFGCHTALVLRRLRRLCNHIYGADPRFVVTSATVANPLQLAARLLGVDEEEVALVGPERDGSPCALRRFVLWNPPLTERAMMAAEVAAGLGGSITRTEARVTARISRNAERARERQLLQEARGARARMSQLAVERLAGGVTGAAAQEEMLQLAAAARPLPQLKEALFGGSPRKRRAAQQRLAEVQAATIATAVDAAASTAAAATGAQTGCRGPAAVSEPVMVKKEDLDDTKAPVGAVNDMRTHVATKAVPLPPSQQARPGDSGSGRVPEGGPTAVRDVAAMAAEVRAALSAAVDTNGSGGITGNRRPLPSLASAVPSATPKDVAALTPSTAAAAATPPHPQPSRPIIVRASGTAMAAAALGLRQADDGVGPAAATAADPRVVRELLSRLPGPEWKEKHGAAGTPLEHRRDSPIVEMALLLAECVQHGLRTIAFCKSRKLCELVLAYTRETLAACAPDFVGRVKVYRAGYSPAERRAMEADIHSGRLLALAATNALELGVDVGGLDVTLHLGFPGSVASLRQQAGRAGRRERESLSLVVAFDGPLDQHFMRHPEHLFGRPVESVQVDVHNPDVLQQHLLCAALEHPLLLDQDMPFFGPPMTDAATRLLAASLISRRPGVPSGSGSGAENQGSWLSVPLVYCGPKDNPASAICLRSIDPERFVIWDETTRMPLEEIEANMAFYEVYDGAVYMFQGRPYLCRQLNLGERVAIVRPADVKYYTKVKDYTDVHVTGGRVAYPAPTPALQRVMGLPESGPGSTAVPGRCGTHGPGVVAVTAPVQSFVLSAHEQADPGLASATANAAGADALISAAAAAVTSTVSAGAAIGAATTTANCERALVVVRYLGFHRVWQGSNRLFDTVDLFLPDIIYETQAAYVRVPPSARRECSARGISFREGCHAANHALLNVVPLFLIANMRDLGTECDNPYDARYRIERLLVYDKHRGGMGISLAAAPLFPVLLERAHRLVSECSCPYAKGCPQCVQHLECRNYNAVLSKAGAEVVLRHVLQQERVHAEAEETAAARVPRS